MDATEAVRETSGKKSAGRSAFSGKIKVALFLIILVASFIGIRTYSNSYPYSAKVSGVEVRSKIPLEKIQGWVDLALENTSGGAELTCNFELAAVSVPNRRGYKIRVERGEQGVYVREVEAYIQGKTDDELLDACHVFACLRENIKCPDNFTVIRKIIENTDDFNVIVDSDVSGAGARGYAEILGALGFLQASRVDINKDGFLDKGELAVNSVFIHSYVRENKFECVQQPLSNLVQAINMSSNNSRRDCIISPGIYVTKSGVNEIRVDGYKIILAGDDEHLHTEAIILRDIISPKWIRAVYGLD